MLGHSHDHGHSHGPSAFSNTRTFAWVTLLNLGFTVIEALYGFLTNSLALLTDALHNLGDVLGLGLAWAAAALAKRPPSGRHTYGWRRATLLSPLANAVLLVAFSGALAWEAIRRFSAPPEVPGIPVMAVAAIGIAINLGAAWFVRDGHEHDLNRRGAYLHLVADAAVSLAAVLAGAGMWWLGWTWLDPATALLVALVVAVGSFGLLRDAFNAAMDAVPRGIDQQQVRDWLLQQPGVSALHHLHIWSLGAGEIAMTAHLVRAGDADHDAFIDRLNDELDERFGINHPTLQIERRTGAAHDCNDRAPHGQAAGHHDHGHDHEHDHHRAHAPADGNESGHP